MFTCGISIPNFDRDHNTLVFSAIPKVFLIYIVCTQFSLELIKCLINVHILTPHDLSATFLLVAFTEFDFCSLARTASLLSNTLGLELFLSFCSSFRKGCAYLLRLLCSTSESQCGVLCLLILFVLTVLCSDPGFLSPRT